ncbi:MAG: V-type ATP synthase subunit A [Synergistaceae bacterium]|jgi:V/A-type H+-transporting ATPase subunit A|nr:V-type ATP synthase subunit A [Synergistaceae bacterium]
MSEKNYRLLGSPMKEPRGESISKSPNRGAVKIVSGPVVTAKTDFSVRMFEVVRVGVLGLLGEVIRIRDGEADIQTCEDTTGLRVGEEILFTGELLGIELGPGLLGTVLDGTGRPLRKLGEKGIYLERGAQASALSDDKLWRFTPATETGEEAGPGDVLGTVVEGSRFLHRVLFPANLPGGRVSWIAPEGDRRVRECICRLDNGAEITLSQRWELRVPRPAGSRLPSDRPLLTGQRVLDTLFPLALGGTAVLPGGFGTGKTVTQQSLARWCNADVIVYVGCGERGNEMTEVLEEFPTLTDPRYGTPLMERMVLVANTSNMPVAAREASIYLGMTLAEYYRDMGYDVAVMADSTSRWAEALREIGGRLEEMPGEEGYPAYLGSRLSRYYERTGRVEVLGRPRRQGSVTAINAVSPAGGDFSEPVTQASLRLSGAFWGLDKNLAQARHFPAINWRVSYSLYENLLSDGMEEMAGENWTALREYLKGVLLHERELSDLVRLLGRDGLSEEDKWALYHAENLKILYLQQNAYSPEDACFSLTRSAALLSLLRTLDEKARKAIADGLYYDEVVAFPIRSDLMSLRALPENALSEKAGEWLSAMETKFSAAKEKMGTRNESPVER